MNLAEMPDALVNNILATEFVGRCGGREGVEDLGWLGASHFALPSFTAEVTEGLKSRASVAGKIAQFKELSSLEDSHLEIDLNKHGEFATVVCDMLLPTELVGMSCSEWVQLAVMIEIVRSVVGPQWTPVSLNFRTTFKPANDARTAFPNTQFKFGQPKTSMTINSDFLDCCNLGGAFDSSHQTSPVSHCQIKTIKQLIRPYLLAAPPPIEVMAEMAAKRPRSFQRWLLSKGTSYRELVNEVRIEMAAELLANEDLNLIQVAMHLGYENQSNFGRSFKKMTGISPAMYRRGLKKNKALRDLKRT
ncbi:AraC family transcriptional regulator [uncultured Shimia sp.]|uniref:helix-turn-helix transcriptional regulator n=1 Tax=uncultured Shimia sp. TaxID=573152 RepID=UPI002606C613|nr:AraC family transcriptional regulator [uncultured Shimia sp.]